MNPVKIAFVLFFICVNSSDANVFIPNVASSPQPVGSGARALGIGAFIGVADDATASSWNPGGLRMLRSPEISFVLTSIHRSESLFFSNNPESNKEHGIQLEDLNYLSIAYPVELFYRNMAFAISYQHLYDFTKSWRMPMVLQQIDGEIGDQSLFTVDQVLDYQQSGRLSAIGLSYCIEIIPELSFGLTLNIYDNDLTSNNWEETLNVNGTMSITPLGPLAGEQPVFIPNSFLTRPFDVTIKQKYIFGGINFNLGMLWDINQDFTLGWVFKSPFRGDLEIDDGETKVTNKMDLPMTFGVGFSYKHSNQFKVSLDISRTDWQKCRYTDVDGIEKSLISDKPLAESDVKPTHQVRMGFEYRFEQRSKQLIIPLRAGIYYDPSPSEGSNDDYYGFSIGLGVSRFARFGLDVSYCYRFGNDVGAAVLSSYPHTFSQDVSENSLYSSLVLHF